MATPSKQLMELETKFWQSMVDNDTDTALGLLAEPALMVSSHGAMKFDHAGYRKMAEQGTMVLNSFEFSDMDVVMPNDSTAVVSYRVKQGTSVRGKSEKTVQEMNDTSTWVKEGGQWKCVMHTETPAPSGKAH
ncbi:hypothetical protein BH09PSE5_BH09PSE5_14860 [soil metagenome]